MGKSLIKWWTSTNIIWRGKERGAGREFRLGDREVEGAGEPEGGVADGGIMRLMAMDVG
jgi:hypothetical protein